MAADESTDWLIDLLYEEYEDDEAPDADGLTPEQAAELDEFRSFMGDVRASLPDAEPGTHVRASLLEAASAQVESMGVAAAEEASSAARRPARVGPAPRDTIWSRARFSTIAQISGVAIVLIVGAFSLSQLQVSAGREPASEIAMADGVRPDDFPNQQPAAKEAATEEPAPEAADEAKTIALGDLNTERERQQQGWDEGSRGYVEELENSYDQRRGVTKKRKAKSFDKKSIAGAPADSSLLFEDEKSGGRSTSNSFAMPSKVKSTTKLDRSRPSALSERDLADDDYAASGTKSDDLFAAKDRTASNRDVDAPMDPAPRPKSEPAPSTASTPPAPTLDGLTKSASTTRAGARKEAEEKAEAAAVEQEVAAGAEQVAEEAKKPAATPSYAAVMRAKNTGDSDKTIEEGERFIESGLGTNSQRAEVLKELMDAHQREGNTAKSNQYEARLRKEHPGYYNQKKIGKKRRSKKKMSAPKNTFDSIESYDAQSY